MLDFYEIQIIYFLFAATIFASLLLKSPRKQDFAEKRKTQEFFQYFLCPEPTTAQTSV